MNQIQIAPAYGRKESYFPDDGAIETSYTVCVLPPYVAPRYRLAAKRGWRPLPPIPKSRQKPPLWLIAMKKAGSISV